MSIITQLFSSKKVPQKLQKIPQKSHLDAVLLQQVGQVDIDAEEYRKLAENAGFENIDIVLDDLHAADEANKFRQFLADNGIAVYPERSVASYMNSITPGNKRWGWRSVNKSVPVLLLRSNGDYLLVGSGMGWSVHNYSKPIPTAVLIVMGNIRQAFPQVQFQITDILNVPLEIDPFLRVSINEQEWYIIERWDEPGFRQ